MSIGHARADAVEYNGENYTPQHAAIDASSLGDNTIVSAPGTGSKIIVLSVLLASHGTVDAKFQTDAGGGAVDLQGAVSMVDTSGYVLNFSPTGHFETADNEVLNLNLSAAVQVTGNITYITPKA